MDQGQSGRPSPDGFVPERRKADRRPLRETQDEPSIGVAHQAAVLPKRNALILGNSAVASRQQESIADDLCFNSFAGFQGACSTG
jgi:hypothetical protein